MPLRKAVALMAGLACAGVLAIAGIHAAWLSMRQSPEPAVPTKIARVPSSDTETNGQQSLTSLSGGPSSTGFPAGPGLGTLEVRATDTPAKGMGAISLTISKIEVRGEDADGSAVWSTLLDAPSLLNLLSLAGLEGNIASAPLLSGAYQHIRFTVGDAFLTTAGGPRQIVLSTNSVQPAEGFAIETGKTTVVTVDWASSSSTVKVDGVSWDPAPRLWVRDPTLQTELRAKGTLVLPIHPAGGSTQTGVVHFLPRGESTEVLISMSAPQWATLGAGMPRQTASLRAGSCSAEGAVKRTLAVLKDGTSGTTLDLSLSGLRTTGSSVWVRHSKEVGGGVAACAELPPLATDVTIELDAARGSSISGWATLSPQEGQTLVSLRMLGDLQGDVTLREGRCGQLGQVLHELGSIAHGRSSVQAPLRWDVLTESTVSLAVHKAQGEARVLAACGVVPQVWASRLTPFAY